MVLLFPLDIPIAFIDHFVSQKFSNTLGAVHTYILPLTLMYILITEALCG